MRTEILRLQQATPTSTPQATINPRGVLHTEQIKNLGEDDATAMAQAAVNAAMKVARETVTAEIKPLLTRQQEDSEAEAARKVREFEEAVEEAVPNYRVLDKDEGWLTGWTRKTQRLDWFGRRSSLAIARVSTRRRW